MELPHSNGNSDGKFGICDRRELEELKVYVQAIAEMIEGKWQYFRQNRKHLYLWNCDIDRIDILTAYEVLSTLCRDFDTSVTKQFPQLYRQAEIEILQFCR